MAKIKFHGAAGTVTGSCFEVTSNKGSKILIDFGMFQGPKEISKLNFEKPQFDFQSISGAVLTHAHLDHCGRLPLLSINGYKNKVFMTKATIDIIDIALHDAAKIASRDRRPNLYGTSDVERVLQSCSGVEYREPFTIDGFKITLRDAGHILGSASIEVEVDGQKLVFSGDLGNTPEDLLKPTEKIDSAEVVLLESTYGGRLHPEEPSEEIFRREINTIEMTGGVLLIPSFSIERTQILLHLIDHFKKQGKVKNETQVFLDSPMALKVTRVFKKYPGLYNVEAAEHARNDDPFDFPGFTAVESVKQSKRLKNISGPKVIIAGSGMMTGGRILHHALDYFSIDSTRLLIVGFQAKGTLGRRIHEGEKKIKMYGERVNMKAQVTEISGFSAHADQVQLLDWLRAIKNVKQVIIIHGEDEEREALKKKINSDLNISNILLPNLHEEINLL